MSLLSASWLDEFRASWIFMVSALSTQATSLCTRLYDDCPQETTKQRTQQKSEWKYAKHQLQSQQEHTRTTAFKAYSAFRCGLKIKEAKNRPTWFTMFTLVRNSTIYKNERYWQKWTLLTFHMKTQPVWPRSKSRPSTNGFQQPTSMRFGKTVQAWTQKRLPHVLTSLMVTCCYFNVLPEETESCTGYGNSFQQANWTNPRFFACTTKNSVHSFPNVFLTTIWVKQIHKQTYMQTNWQPNNQANEANPS